MPKRDTFFEPPTTFTVAQHKQSNKAVLDEYIALNAKWKKAQDYETLALIPLLVAISIPGLSFFSLIVGSSLTVLIVLSIATYKAYCLDQEHKLIKKSMEHATDEDKQIVKEYYILTALQQVDLTCLNISGILLFLECAGLFSPLVFLIIGLAYTFSASFSIGLIGAMAYACAKNHPHKPAPDHPYWSKQKPKFGGGFQAVASIAPVWLSMNIFLTALIILGSSPPVAAPLIFVGVLGSVIGAIGWISSSYYCEAKQICNACDPVFWLLENEDKASCEPEKERVEIAPMSTTSFLATQ